MTRTIQAAGVTFRQTDFDGYFACNDCDGLVAVGDYEGYGVAPSEHTCSV